MHPAYQILQRPKLNWSWKLEPEQKLSVEVADMLRAFTLQGKLRGVWHAVPNEGKRNRIVACIMKAMGLLPGVADLSFKGAWGGGYIELKTEKGRQQGSQKQFQAWCEQEGVNYALCRSLGDVMDTLKAWGAL